MKFQPAALFLNHRLQVVMLASQLALLSSMPSSASIYIENFTDAGPIPQGGLVLSAEQSVSGATGSITSVELILTFNDSASLGGNIQGSLNLGTGAGSPSVSFIPSATSSSGAERIYDATFSGLNGDNPNVTWTLVLWDTSSSGMENGLVGWTLDLNTTAVPEPVNAALAVLGVGFVVGGGIRWCRRFCSRFLRRGGAAPVAATASHRPRLS